MGALTRLLPAILLLAATPAKADEVERWRPMIEEASTRFGIPTSWIERVMRAESRGLTMLNGRPIRSRAGAMGLMRSGEHTSELQSLMRLSYAVFCFKKKNNRI